ncbi:hypothetical protein JHK87_043319 [Glycine soja]|nr:hypothetical protein JHK87_043319 [Glycine soja]
MQKLPKLKSWWSLKTLKEWFRISHKSIKLSVNQENQQFRQQKLQKVKQNSLKKKNVVFLYSNRGWKEELQTAVVNVASVITELDVAKQELSKIHQGYDLSLEARVSATKQAAEAEHAMKANTERACELSKEILVVQESVSKMNAESVQAHQLQEETLAEQKLLRQSYEAILKESKKKLLDLKKEFNPELIKNIEAQLTETMIEIGVLQKQIKNKKTSDLDSFRSVTQDLGDGKESLQKVTGQEDTLRSMVEALGMELENEKESKTESIVENLQVEVWKSEFELEVYLAGEPKARGASSEEMILTLKQLFSETENARREIQDMKNDTAELEMEAASSGLAVEEVEAANAAEASVIDQIKVLSMRTSPSHSSPSEPSARITISREEFQSLVHKVEESDKLADIKVAAATAQVEVAKASENEVLKRLEETQKEIEDMKSEPQAALKRAEMAEAAKRAVEGELRKWRERQQKKAAEMKVAIQL